MNLEDIPEPEVKRKPLSLWVFDILLILVLLGGLYLRAVGLLWGENQGLHPDERFLTWVGTDINPIKSIDSETKQKTWISLSEYFDSANSPLNPVNRGHTFYVYGTFPMLATRYLVEWIYGHSGFEEMTVVGRSLSTIADLLTILLVYLVAERLYDRRVGLLAAAFSAVAVMQIQQSHYFTMDTFINFFTFLAFYFAIRIQVDRRAWEEKNFFRHPLFFPSLGFAIAFGMAMASKINAAPMALALPAAIGLRIFGAPEEKRLRLAISSLSYLAMAGAISFLVFRVLQPYAFSGPGFFDLKPDEHWMASMRELRNQNTPEVDFPPAMQWARRPIWFSAQNMILWGLGLPLGVLAWFGFLWVGWRMLKGEWQHHILIWGWTALYFIWQSLKLNPTMRYQLPIYPTLTIFAAWAVFALWDLRKARDHSSFNSTKLPPQRWSKLSRVIAVLVGGVVLISTTAYAIAFSQMYARPITRLEASRWIYQNIPGPINLHIQTGDESFQQILPFPYDAKITADLPFSTSFKARTDGILKRVSLPHPISSGNPKKSLLLSIYPNENLLEPLASASLTADFSSSGASADGEYVLTLDRPLELSKGQNYWLKLEMVGQPATTIVATPPNLSIQTNDGSQVDQPLLPAGEILLPEFQHESSFTAVADGMITELHLPSLTGNTTDSITKTLYLSLGTPGDEFPDEPANLVGNWTPGNGVKPPGYTFSLNDPIFTTRGENYSLRMLLPSEDGTLALTGTTIANEGEWDDGIPYRIDGYDAMGGIYPQDVNFNMYWDDNPEKLQRFTRILDQSEYIFITSNRQWGSLPRIPERFPMTTVYYRNLLGCPPERNIEWCYRVAEPGKFQGNLGFDLVKTFTSEPRLGAIRLNDQFAEEAFTVYDHPKVFIFKKNESYNPQQVRDILGSVDFSKVIRIPPLKFGSQTANLMLPAERLAEQRQGGTWAELFNSKAVFNRYPFLGAMIWYISLGVLGLITYPVVRLALPGLEDGGYPFARIAGLLLLAYPVWLAGSLRFPATRLTITVVILLLVLVGVFYAYLQRHELRQEWRDRKKYFLLIEALFLGLFLLDLLIRLGNPDLWHPFKGGEKPMDFAYFNAVLRSTSFPPYDPWYAGGYLNYYYYGFVLFGMLVKWLGIQPSIAYNLIIPSIFALMAIGAFSIVWNLIGWIRNHSSHIIQFGSGLAGALGIALIGNLGIIKMIFQGYQKLVAPGGVIEGASLLTRLGWAWRGFLQVMTGEALPYGIGDWYWNPSRVIPALNEVEPITEFPFFTVLYADLHAHLFALPLALLVIAFALSIVLAHGHWRSGLGVVTSFLMGGLAIGALRPTNAWDFYTYLPLGAIAVGYALWVNYRPVVSTAEENPSRRIPIWENMPDSSRRFIIAAIGVLALAGLAILLYQPYTQWYGQGYSKVELWKGTQTPLGAYLIHWGLFLFLILTWMIWETLDWMASTPVSALQKLKPYKGLIWTGILLLLLLMSVLGLKLSVSDKQSFLRGVHVAWLALPLAGWAGVLLLRPGQPDRKRFTLFLVGTGLILTLIVELVVLRGDIARMNTVFKFYLQAWTFFAISAAAALGWIWLSLPRWTPGWRKAWQAGLALLAAAAMLYPLLATRAKIEDRMTEQAPHTLNGMAFMPYASYADEWGAMDLSQDYNAIRWLQENVVGSPVIVEANLRNLYRWGSRMSNYTGLPGVVGWEWHQQQQRALLPGSWVSNRIAEIDEFYQTTDVEKARDFLMKYDVQYIILGQQERGHYPGPGLDKFEAQDGVTWQEVFRDRDTVIYQVLPSSEGVAD